MNMLVQAFENFTTTTNGNPAFLSTLNKGLDYFSAVGSTEAGSTPLAEFKAVYRENPELALRLLLWARDCRGGAGKRDPIRLTLPWLSQQSYQDAIRVLEKLPELGRWKDVLVGLDCVPEVQTVAVYMIASALDQGNKLCAKWMPRKGKTAAKLRSLLGLSPKRYRKLLVGLTNVVETQMCDKKWSEINFSHVPSVAFSRYTQAFTRHQPERFAQFLEDVKSGKKKINVGSVLPHDVLRAVKNGNSAAADEQWELLPNYVPEEESIITLLDVSGSMYFSVAGSMQAVDIACALGIYTADRLIGPFKNRVITFQTNPQWQKLEGTLTEKYNQALRTSWGGSTNFAAALDLIVNTAVQYNVPQSDMPTVLLCLSDMQFNAAGAPANQLIHQKFEDAGYKVPRIVFWNLRAKTTNFPANAHDEDVVMVGGWSPVLLKSILTGNTPVENMLSTIMVDRYNPYKDENEFVKYMENLVVL